MNKKMEAMMKKKLQSNENNKKKGKLKINENGKKAMENQMKN